MGDFQQIEIRRLRVTTHIGVPDEERAVPQELRISLLIGVGRDFSGMGDRLGETLDYAALVDDLQVLAASRPRLLIETLAAEIADHVLSFALVTAVDVTVEKFILPATDCVAVRMRREKPAV